jgi:hypothetical protein
VGKFENKFWQLDTEAVCGNYLWLNNAKKTV